MMIFWAINDGGEFGRSICKIYPKNLELRFKHQGDHATFLNLDITIKEETFKLLVYFKLLPLSYKLFDKRDSFSFSVVRMPHIESNIPENIFYSAIDVFLRTARSNLCLRDFIPKAKELLERMKQRGSKCVTTCTSLRIIILAHPKSFQHFSISCQALLNIFSEDNF